jgi:spermidine/putrescine transport system substrate-binding protein
MKSGWDLPWASSRYRGRVALLDDYREGLSLGLMHNGVFDLNTTDPGKIAAARQSLQELQSLVSVRIDNNDYTDVPDGKTWIHHAWSGDIAAAASYVPKGTPVDVVGYWFPPDGKGPVANDTIVALASGQNPVLAHEFLNYMLEVRTVFTNISYNGYMQPLTAVTPQKLVSEGILPASLMSTAVVPSYFDRGVMELELSPAVTSMWEQAWSQFSEGL